VRLDKYLVDQGLISTRSQALQLIKDGHVLLDGVVVKKPATLVGQLMKVEISKEHVFVGRGAEKLQYALEYFSVDVSGKVGIDIGASTGGFTEVLLLKGINKVYAIDVGHDQLAVKLKNDSRVENLEGINARETLPVEEGVDLAVMDVSYISIRLLLNNLRDHMLDNGKIITLFKPQFEAGRELLGKGGIVKSIETHKKLLEDFYEWSKEFFLLPSGFCQSPIKGKTGNQEFFFYFDLSGKSPSLNPNFFRSME